MSRLHGCSVHWIQFEFLFFLSVCPHPLSCCKSQWPGSPAEDPSQQSAEPNRPSRYSQSGHGHHPAPRGPCSGTGIVTESPLTLVCFKSVWIAPESSLVKAHIDILHPKDTTLIKNNQTQNDSPLSNLNACPALLFPRPFVRCLQSMCYVGPRRRTLWGWRWNK